MLSKEQIKSLVLAIPMILILVCLVWLLRVEVDKVEEQRALSEATERKHTLFDFDPNTISFWELRDLGFSKRDAAGIIKYRSRGKIFEIKEDFATCYNVSDSMYSLLEPHIRIGQQFAVKKFTYRDTPNRNYKSTRSRHEVRPYEPFRLDSVTAKYLQHIGFSPRQAQIIIDYRNMRRGIYSTEELAECFVVDSATAAQLTPYIIFPTRGKNSRGLVDINRADSATLCSVYGIGSKSAAAIIAYRLRLGGFCSVEQLSEVKSVTESNFERILPQIYCDSFSISKIDVNFAPPNVLGVHPYINPKLLRRIIKYRQLEGGWNSIEEMKTYKILSPEEAQRLRPYLRFEKQRQMK